MTIFAEHRRVYSHTYDADTRQLTESFYENTFIGVVVARAGALSDGASAPIFTLNCLGLSRFDPEIERAVWLHDLLYGCGFVTKEDADRIFFETLMEDGLGRVRASILYRAVSYGGHKRFMSEPSSDTFIELIPNANYTPYKYVTKIKTANRPRRNR